VLQRNITQAGKMLQENIHPYSILVFKISQDFDAAKKRVWKQNSDISSPGAF
jgi:hypothetical protein